MNPIERRISEGMNPIEAFLTDATCGEACWEAREDICRCSCGGKNHGCMRTSDGVRPVRSAKIDGVRYTLRAVGCNVYGEAKAINKANPKPAVSYGTNTVVYSWGDNERNAPARVKSATKDQLAKWPELASFQDAIDKVRAISDHCGMDVIRIWPHLLWIKTELHNAEIPQKAGN